MLSCIHLLNSGRERKPDEWASLTIDSSFSRLAIICSPSGRAPYTAKMPDSRYTMLSSWGTVSLGA